MTTMQALVLRSPQQLEIMTIPCPEPGPGQTLMKVTACGICGSDLRYFAGENPWAVHTLGYEKPNPPDMVLGHEIAGLVDGQRVAALSFIGCGRCADCRAGREHLCPDTAHLGHGAGWEELQYNPGGMAQYCPVWTHNLFALPAGISDAEGIFLDGLGVAVHAVRMMNALPGSDVLIFGAGPIGLSIMQVALALGARRAFVVDRYAAALECASELGATEVFNLAEGDFTALTKELLQTTGGRGMEAIYESTGNSAAQQAGLKLLSRGAGMMLMAGAAKSLSLDGGVLAGEKRILTCANNHREDYQIGLDLLTCGRVKVMPMITHCFSLNQALEAFEVASSKTGTGALKVIIEP